MNFEVLFTAQQKLTTGDSFLCPVNIETHLVFYIQNSQLKILLMYFIAMIVALSTSSTPAI